MTEVMTQTELLEEIEALVLARIELGLITDTMSIAKDILDAHDDLHGADTDFYELCAWNHVRVSIRMVLRDHKLTGEKRSDQLLLPGFDHLQKAYAIEQEHEPKVVPIDKMSKEELIAKADELRQMAEGCIKHAAELDRYRIEKFGE